MICYRLKHLPTGLYYHSATEVKIKIQNKAYYVKTNLGKKGKIYTQKPSLAWVRIYYNHIQLFNDLMLLKLESESGVINMYDRNIKYKVYPYVAAEWEVEEL